MKPVIYTKEPAKYIPANCCIVAPQAEHLPEHEFIPFENSDLPLFADRIASAETLVLVNVMKRLVRHSEVFKIFRRNKNRIIIIEDYPYYVYPWKIYYPYSFYNKTFLGYPHSYAIEGEYKKYKNGERENPCSIELIGPQILESTEMDYEKIFPQIPEIVEENVSSGVRSEYEKYKVRLFETEKGIAAVLRKLNRFVQDRVPRRQIPLSLKEIYQPNFGLVIKTDLPLDNYLFSEMMELVKHSNHLSEYLYNKHYE